MKPITMKPITMKPITMKPITMKPILEINESTFEAEVLQSREPVLISFSTDWTLRSQRLISALEGIADELGDRIRVAWVSLDDNVDLSLAQGIQFIPTLLYFVNGKVRARIVGTTSKETILSQLTKLAGVE